METFSTLKKALLDLERLHLERLRANFVWNDDLQSCITGAVQFGILDSHHSKTAQALPVVVAVGINYTQKNDAPDPGNGIYSFLGGSSGACVVDDTRCCPATAMAIAAYNRNADAWIRPPEACYPGEFEPTSYAAVGATTRATLASEHHSDIEDGFILIMTNQSPFITRLRWQEQVRKTPSVCDELLGRYSSTEYLDALFRTIRESVDLWIGHSAIPRTKYVWPAFLAFVNRHRIEQWLLSPNLNPQPYLSLDGVFRKKELRDGKNPRFALFGPEKA